MSDAITLILRGLRRHYRIPPIDLIACESRPWASITFTGGRHKLSLHLPAGLDLNQVPEIDFGVGGGHLVADIVVADRYLSDGVPITLLEALTVHDMRPPILTETCRELSKLPRADQACLRTSSRSFSSAM